MSQEQRRLTERCPSGQSDVDKGQRGMQPGEEIPNPPETQFFAPQQIVQDGQNHQPMASQQQIVYIDLNYRPKVNLRMWSYLVIGIGIAIYIAFIFGNIWFGILSGFLGQSICCLFLLHN